MAFGDAGYQGVEKREESRKATVEWRVAMKPGKRKLLDGTELGRLVEQLLAFWLGQFGASAQVAIEPRQPSCVLNS